MRRRNLKNTDMNKKYKGTATKKMKEVWGKVMSQPYEEFFPGEDVWYLYGKPLRVERGVVCERRDYLSVPRDPKASDVYCRPDERNYCIRLRDFEAFHTKEELIVHYLDVLGVLEDIMGDE